MSEREDETMSAEPSLEQASSPKAEETDVAEEEEEEMTTKRNSAGSMSERATSPGSMSERATSPVSTSERATTSGSTSERAAIPGSTSERATSSGYTSERATSPGSTSERATSSGSMSERATSPGSTSERATSSGSMSERATSPGSLSERATSPGSTSERATSPGSTSERATSPGSTSERATSPGSTSERATSPGSVSERAPRSTLRSISDLINNGLNSSTNSKSMKGDEADDLQLDRTVCPNHPETERRQIELYCMQCHECLCWKCKYTHHNDHSTEEVTMTAKRVKIQIAEDEVKLRLVNDELLELWKSSSEDLQHNVKSKKEILRTAIDDRHKLLVGIAESVKDEAMHSLETATTSIHVTSDNLLATWRQMDGLHKRMVACAAGRKAGYLVVTAGKIYTEWEQRNVEAERLQKNTPAASGLVSRPMLKYSLSPALFAEECRKFVGAVVRKEWPMNSTDIRISLQFHSKKGKERDIFALMATSDVVYLSYDVSPADWVECPPEMFHHDGKVVKWTNPPPSKGRSSFTILETGHFSLVNHKVGGVIHSYAKSRRGVLLQNDLKGAATVMRTPDDTTTTSLEAVQTDGEIMSMASGQKTKRKLTIQCGPHRAFDIHPTEHIPVVVEEPVPASAGSRTVVMFINGERELYQSPVEPYQPSDVCFYQFGQRDVLLVADELNDAIHIVDFWTGKFLRYLASGHPLVFQPTALNVDTRGRLWVACRGGAVLLCEAMTGYQEP